MTAWSDFCRKFATENGITYTAASKLPEVKELYKLQKTEELKEQTAIFEEKMAEAIEIFEAKKALEVLEILEPEPEVPEDSIITVTYEPPAPPPQTPRVFISKQRRGAK